MNVEIGWSEFWYRWYPVRRTNVCDDVDLRAKLQQMNILQIILINKSTFIRFKEIVFILTFIFVSFASSVELQRERIHYITVFLYVLQLLWT